MTGTSVDDSANHRITHDNKCVLMAFSSVHLVLAKFIILVSKRIEYSIRSYSKKYKLIINENIVHLYLPRYEKKHKITIII